MEASKTGGTVKAAICLVWLDYASFCWDGPVTRVDAHRYDASATDFVPKKELKVLFLTMPLAKAAGGGGGSQQVVTGRRVWAWGLLMLVGVGGCGGLGV